MEPLSTTAIALIVGGFCLATGFIIVSIKFIDLRTREEQCEIDQIELRKMALKEVESLSKKGEITPDQAADAYATISAPDTYPDTDFFDEIASSLGINKKTLIWVIVGILAFSMLKG